MQFEKGLVDQEAPSPINQDTTKFTPAEKQATCHSITQCKLMHKNALQSDTHKYMCTSPIGGHIAVE